MRWCNVQTKEYDLQAKTYPTICTYHKLCNNNESKFPIFPECIFTCLHITNTMLAAALETLTKWGQDKLAAISQTPLSNAFFLMTIFESTRKSSLQFVSKGSVNNIRALFQIMACRLLGNKPLSETKMARLLTHICVTRPQLVKSQCINRQHYQGSSLRPWPQKMTVFSGQWWHLCW